MSPGDETLQVWQHVLLATEPSYWPSITGFISWVCMCIKAYVLLGLEQTGLVHDRHVFHHCTFLRTIIIFFL